MEKKGVFKMRKANTSRRFSPKVGVRVAKVLIGVASVTVLLSMSGQIASAESMLALDSEMRMEALNEVTEMSGDSSQDAATTDQPWDGMSPGDDPSSTPGGGDSEGSDSSTIPGDDSSPTPSGGDDSSSTPSGDSSPTPSSGDDSSSTPSGDDKPATTTSKRKVLAYTGGNTNAFMAMGLAIMLIGAGLFSRNIVAGKDK